MNALALNESTGTRTISSLELADISGRRHDSILRSIESMNSDLIDMGKPQAVVGSYKAQNNKTLPLYHLTPYQCKLLALALSGEARIRVLDRLEELESGVRGGLDIAKIDINDRHAIFDVLTGIQHLTANIYTAYEREKAQSELATKTANNVIEVMHKSAHKLNAYDQMIDAKGWLSFESAASVVFQE